MPAFEFFNKQVSDMLGNAPFMFNNIDATEIYLQVHNRKLTEDVNEMLNFKKFKPEFFGMPILVNIDENLTGRELYELVWMRMQSFLKDSSVINNE